MTQDTARLLRWASKKVSESMEAGAAREKGLEHSGHGPAKGGSVFPVRSQ